MKLFKDKDNKKNLHLIMEFFEANEKYINERIKVYLRKKLLRYLFDPIFIRERYNSKKRYS